MKNALAKFRREVSTSKQQLLLHRSGRRLNRLAIVMVAAWLTALAPAVQALDVTGTYSVDTPWGEIQLSLRQAGIKVTGEMLGYDGRIYPIQGEAEKDNASGLVLGPVGNSEFELYFDEDDETWSFDLEPQNAGYVAQSQEFPVRRISATPSSFVGKPSAVGKAKSEHDTNTQLDPTLVGTWAYQEVMSSGGMSVASQLVMQFQPDGVFLQGDARTLFSGPGVGLDSGVGNPVERGYWRASGGQLSAGVDGINFVPLARYQINGQSLLLRYNDNSTQLWTRVR
jgi:hypothetical protein